MKALVACGARLVIRTGQPDDVRDAVFPSGGDHDAGAARAGVVRDRPDDVSSACSVNDDVSPRAMRGDRHRKDRNAESEPDEGCAETTNHDE